MQYSTRILGAIERDAQKHLWSKIQREITFCIFIQILHKNYTQINRFAGAVLKNNL